VIQYNEIAKDVANEVGAVIVEDLYQYVEDFCQAFPKLNASTGYGGNYTTCAIQTTGLHFYDQAPMPSGQQYTGIGVAEAAIRRIPNDEINNKTTWALDTDLTAPANDCGNPPAPLSPSLPNVLIIGDSISMPTSGYGPGVEAILAQPRPGQSGYKTGPLASVQHNGGTGSNQAGPTTNGAQCIHTWLGEGKWDVITINFGIHDCCPGGDGRPPGQNVPKAEYIKNLNTIFEAASGSLAPGGKIVWVTTTPVSNTFPVCNLTGDAFNQCVDEYNQAALELAASRKDIVVADLNEAVRDVCGQDYATCNLQRYDNVHFTDAGKQYCAVVVAKAVAPLLGPKWNALTTKDDE